MAQNWSYVGAGAVQVGNSAPTVPVPSGIRAGDLLVIFSAMVSGFSSGTPSGWTAAPNNGAYGWIYYKIATASESAVSFSGGASPATTVMLAYRDVSGFDVEASIATSLTTHTLTTTATDDLIISMFGINTSGSGTWSAPSGTTTRISSSPGGSGHGLLIVDEDQAASGTSTARTASGVGGGTTGSIAIAFTQSLVGAAAGNMFLIF